MGSWQPVNKSYILKWSSNLHFLTQNIFLYEDLQSFPLQKLTVTPTMNKQLCQFSQEILTTHLYLHRCTHGISGTCLSSLPHMFGQAILSYQWPAVIFHMACRHVWLRKLSFLHVDSEITIFMFSPCFHL